MSLLQDMLRRLRLPVLLRVWLGALLLAGLAIVALLVPDAHIYQLLFSFVLGLALVAGFLWLCTAVLRSLRQPVAPAPLLPSCGAVALWLALLRLLQWLASLLQQNIALRAGYWNSRLNPSERHVATFDRLSAWQSDGIAFATLILIPALLLPFLVQAAAFAFRADGVRDAARVLRRWQHWCGSVVLLGLAVWIAPRLADWHPTDTVRGEIVSALLRLLTDFLLVSFLGVSAVALDAALLAREAARASSTPHSTL